jgi:hypothetical protein
MLNPNSMVHAAAAQTLQENFRVIAVPRQDLTKQLLAFWNARPADGIVVGRDVPARKIARLLSHVMIWEAVAGGEDFRLQHMGEAIRRRFGDNVTGKLMSELMAPEIFAYHRDVDRKLLTVDDVALFEVTLVSPAIGAGEGSVQLHYELVKFPVHARDGKSRLIMSGTFYFG